MPSPHLNPNDATPMTWTAPTQREYLAEERAARALAAPSEPASAPAPLTPPPSQAAGGAAPAGDGGGGNPTVTCGCGRKTSADMLVDVRGMDAALRAKLPHGGDFQCDGCRERAFMGGALTREEFYRAIGAPPEALERIRLFTLRRGAR